VSGPISGDQPDAASDPGNGDHVNLFRAGVIIVAGLIVGVLLLNVASRPPKVTAGSAATTTTTATNSTTTTVAGHHHNTTTTTLTTLPPSTVTVQVANGTTTPNGAAYYTNVLQRSGWKTQAPLDTTSPVAASTVYYAAGQKSDAESIATQLGLSKTTVQPLTSAVPVNGATGVDIVVIVGNDLAAAMSTTTTTAAA
jgi:hypothetical protein